MRVFEMFVRIRPNQTSSIGAVILRHNNKASAPEPLPSPRSSLYPTIVIRSGSLTFFDLTVDILRLLAVVGRGGGFLTRVLG